MISAGGRSRGGFSSSDDRFGCSIVELMIAETEHGGCTVGNGENGGILRREEEVFVVHIMISISIVEKEVVSQEQLREGGMMMMIVVVLHEESSFRHQTENKL